MSKETLNRIDVFGNRYFLNSKETECYQTLKPLFSEEEQFALKLKSTYELEVREDLLILFVHMYLHRFAIPYFQILNNRFPTFSDKLFLQEILYYCLIGRAVDDIVDNDSEMFKKHESILISDVYSQRLLTIITIEQCEKFRSYLNVSAKFNSEKDIQDMQFSDLEHDVFMRIRYYFLKSEEFDESRRDVLIKYTTVLLAGLDLNDGLADGFNIESSTVVSNNLYLQLKNDEGKVLLDESLFNFYNKTKKLINNERDQVIVWMKKNELNYSFHVLDQL